MADFIVHSIAGSPFGRSVLATLIEKQIDFAFEAVTLDGLQNAPHRKRHPFGRVPVLSHGGFDLYETQAILRYIDRICPDPVLTPRAPTLAARMDQAMNICDWYLFQGVANIIIFQRVIRPELMGLTSDENAIAEAMPRARLVFDELARLLGDQPWFAGEAMTLADLMLAPQIDHFIGLPEWEPLAAHNDNIGQWLSRMNARPAMQQTSWTAVTAMAAA